MATSNVIEIDPKRAGEERYRKGLVELIASKVTLSKSEQDELVSRLWTARQSWFGVPVSLNCDITFDVPEECAAFLAEGGDARAKIAAATQKCAKDAVAHFEGLVINERLDREIELILAARLAK